MADSGRSDRGGDPPTEGREPASVEIEAKARELDGKASYENENFDRNVEKRGLNSPVDQQDRMRWATAARVYGEAADALRSLLDPKEEA